MRPEKGNKAAGRSGGQNLRRALEGAGVVYPGDYEPEGRLYRFLELPWKTCKTPGIHFHKNHCTFLP